MRNLWARLRTRRWRLAVALAAVAAVAFSIVAVASHPEVSLSGSNFEIDTDANLKVDDAAPSIDWANVTELRQADTASGSLDESFGNGAKEDTAVPSVVNGSIPPNKSDLKFFGVYQEGSTATGFLNLYWSRVQEPSGTTNMDFELNKKVCGDDPAPDADCSSNGLTPIRSTGDFLVQYDLSQGGTNPQLFVSRWVTSGATSQCNASNSLPCWGNKINLTDSGDATGSINTTAIASSDSDGLGAHSARTFGEAQLRLSAILGTSGCASIGSAYLKSRSSDSFSAALKDFVPPKAVNITNCGTVNITKTDDATPANALNGATFTLYTDNAPLGGSPPHGAEDTATSITCTSGSDGKCSMTNVPFGQYWVVETTTPSGFNTAADQNVTISSANSTASVTFVNVRQKGSIKFHKEDDVGNLMKDVKFTVKSKVGTAIDTSCTTDATGECTVGNLPLATYTVDEDALTLPSGYSKDSTFPKDVSVTSDGQVVTVNATNPRTHRVIVIVCHEGTNSLYGVTVSGGTDKTSISAVPSALDTKGVTEADLCGIGGASFDGLGHGDKALTAKIATHP
jgi:hypothetical protein